MAGRNRFTIFEIRDGAGNLHYPGERPGTEPQPLHRHFNQPMGIVIQGAEFRNLSIRQSGVAQRLGTGYPFLLFFPRP